MSSFLRVLDSNKPQLSLTKELAATGASPQPINKLRAICHPLEGVVAYEPLPFVQKGAIPGRESGMAEPVQCRKGIVWKR